VVRPTLVDGLSVNSCQNDFVSHLLLKTDQALAAILALKL
jgi:hypothetical protein